MFQLVLLFYFCFFLFTIAVFPRMPVRSGSFYSLFYQHWNRKKLFFYLGILAFCFLVCVPLRNLQAGVIHCDHTQSRSWVSAKSVFQNGKCQALGPLQLFWRSLRRVYRANGNTDVVPLPRDGIAEKKAVFIHNRLTLIRNHKIRKLIQKNWNKTSIQRAIQYIQKVNETLSHYNTLQLKERFDSLENRKSSHLCDGCFLKRSMYIPAKPYVNGELYRKFVGGVETNLIYNISNRSGFMSVSHRVAIYAPANSSYDVTAIYALYGLNRMFTIRELLYRYKG